MNIDPMEHIDQGGGTDETDKREIAEAVVAAEEKRDAARGRLNNFVAVTIALLATFMGICGVKSGNVAEGMQQAQAERNNNYAWYQARNLREEVNRAAAAGLRAQRASLAATADASPGALAALDAQAAEFERLAADQEKKKDKQQADAEAAGKLYDRLNARGDLFDLSEALTALAVSMLALTALTGKRWLFVAALVPTGFGVLYGMAGLFDWSGPLFRPDSLLRFLGV